MCLKTTSWTLRRVSPFLILLTISISSLSAATEVYFAQALRGSTESGTSCILVWNPTDSATTVTLTFTDQSGAVKETQTFVVEADATEKRTLGAADVPLTVGSVSVTAASTSVLATLFFSLPGLPQVGVLPVPGQRSWTGVGRVDEEVNTGLAARGTAGPTTCVLTAYSTDGSMAGTAEIALGTDQQTAMFLNEMIPDLETPYRGCFSLQCEDPVAAVALRQRGDGFFTTIAMGQSEGEFLPVVFYAQALRGSVQNGTSRVLVWNPRDTQGQVQVDFRNQAGTVLETHNVEVPGKATKEITLGGPEVPLSVGSVQLFSLQGILSTLFFRLPDLPEVGVLPAVDDAFWSGVGQVDDEVNTGVALSTTGESTCRLTAYREDGTVVGTKELDLHLDQQKAMFLDELIPALAAPYRGCFDLRCAGSPVVAVALRQQKSDGIFTTIAMSPIPVETGADTDLLASRQTGLNLETNVAQNVVLPLGSRITGSFQSVPPGFDVFDVEAECNNETYPGRTSFLTGDFLVVAPTGVPCNLRVAYGRFSPPSLGLRYTDPTSIQSPATPSIALPDVTTRRSSGTIGMDSIPAELMSFQVVSKSLVFVADEGLVEVQTPLENGGALSGLDGVQLPQGEEMTLPYSVDLPVNKTYRVALQFRSFSPEFFSSFFLGTLDMGSDDQTANFTAPFLVKVSGNVTQSQTPEKIGSIEFFDTRDTRLRAVSASFTEANGVYELYVIRGASYAVSANLVSRSYDWTTPRPFSKTQTFESDTTLDFSFPDFPAETTRLSGQVTDPSGRGVPDVRVDVVCEGSTPAPDTRFERFSQTNSEGHYSILGSHSGMGEPPRL